MEDIQELVPKPSDHPGHVVRKRLINLPRCRLAAMISGVYADDFSLDLIHDATRERCKDSSGPCCRQSWDVRLPTRASRLWWSRTHPLLPVSRPRVSPNWNLFAKQLNAVRRLEGRCRSYQSRSRRFRTSWGGIPAPKYRANAYPRNDEMRSNSALLTDAKLPPI
jgi:hypothetical protein